MNKDSLDTCPKCGCDACYKLPINEAKFSYYCLGCGYQTNDLMIEGEFDTTEYETTLPELYKDAKYVDENKRVWYPVAINLNGKGTVFLNGRRVEEAQWAAIKAVELTEAEKAEPKYKGLTHKSDAKSLKSFEGGFIEACEYIGLFEN